MQKKWKNIRDCYARELKKQRTLSSGKRARRYIYYKRLQFLENHVSHKEKTRNLDKDTTDEASCDEDKDVTGERCLTGPSTLRRLMPKPVEKHSAPIVESSLSARRKEVENSLMVRRKEEEKRNDDDDEKLFCLSLYAELKKVPENFRLKTKIDILNVLQHAQALATSHSTQQPHHSHSHSQPYNTDSSGHTCQTSSSHFQALPSTPSPVVTSSFPETQPIHQVDCDMKPYASTSGYSGNTWTRPSEFDPLQITPSPGSASSVSDTESKFFEVFE